MRKRQWIDVTVPLSRELTVWPGDPAIKIFRLASLDRGDECNLSAMSASLHIGTHIDAPQHYFPGGLSVDQLPLTLLTGTARVIPIPSRKAIRAADLQGHRIRAGERLLFRTRNSRRDWWKEPFDNDFVALEPEASRFLARKRVRVVGIDYLSIGAAGAKGTETHRILLDAGVCVIEGLDLTRVSPGRYDLLCLPLRIAGAEGAPARVLLRPL